MEGIAVPKPQEVQVVLPDGDTEFRLAKFDADAGRLVLSQIADENCEEELGQASVNLSSIGDTSASGKIVKLHAGGANGPVLLELHFSHQKFAQDWARALKPKSQQAAPSPKGVNRVTPTITSKASPKASGRGAACTTQEEANLATKKTLQELCSQQQEQARLLKEITDRKSEQLSKMQERLEEALDMLQVGQATYGKQQATIDENSKIIERLKDQLKAAASVEAECNANARNAASGFAAAKAARAQECTKQPNAGNAGAQLAAALASSGQIGNGIIDDDEPENADLLAKLQALQAEKSQFEEQLRSEQGQIFEQLEELQRMMAELGLEGLSGAA